jgi:hemerythrin-like domain-containing protein
MTPSQQLKDEHEGILVMLKILGKICAKMETQEKVDQGHLDRIVEFFRVFADQCHHSKEEELLFPELEKCGIPKERGPIAVMLSEHTQGRALVRDMGEAVADLKAGKSKARGKFIENAKGYMDLLTQHINKENNVLFPMGDRCLSPEIQKELVEKFDIVEREKIGAGTHEQFHRLLEQLKEKYLNA